MRLSKIGIQTKHLEHNWSAHTHLILRPPCVWEACLIRVQPLEDLKKRTGQTFLLYWMFPTIAIPQTSYNRLLTTPPLSHGSSGRQGLYEWCLALTRKTRWFIILNHLGKSCWTVIGKWLKIIIIKNINPWQMIIFVHHCQFHDIDV